MSERYHPMPPLLPWWTGFALAAIFTLPWTWPYVLALFAVIVGGIVVIALLVTLAAWAA